MKVIKGIVALAVVAIIVSIVILRSQMPATPPPQVVAEQAAAMVESTPPSDSPPPVTPPRAKPIRSGLPQENNYPSSDKLTRLHQIQERFRTLAAGDPAMAIHRAKRITNEVERETALLTLVTEWTHGELSPPRQRAQLTLAYGFETALGLELTNRPDLALVWANELTAGPGRTELLQTIASNEVGANPGDAFALMDQVPEGDRAKFYNSTLSTWAFKDTAAALQWAEQIPDPTGRDAALQTIRAVAPSGIGAQMTMYDGHPVINSVVPGTPAALSGQILPGDRIVAVAQGNSEFVDTRTLPLQNLIDLIRGAPGTPVQLQVVSATAAPDALPRVVTLYRDQIKLKN